MAAGNKRKKKAGPVTRFLNVALPWRKGNVSRKKKPDGPVKKALLAPFRFLWNRKWGIAFWICLIGIITVGGYALYVSPELIEKFEGTTWRIPSKIYSDSLTLLPGQNTDSLRLTKRLMRLNYQKTDSKVLRQGDYRITPGVIDIHLRDFDYPNETIDGYWLRLRVKNHVIQSLSDMTRRKEIYSAEIEPELLARLFGDKREERDLVPLDEVPPTLINAVLAIEDKYFYRHPGVNPVSTMRAVLKNIIQLGGAPGGSTITQQLVKNFYLSPERTATRKVKEMVRALVLEMMYSKDEILSAYLNEIYFGQSGSVAIHGVGQASRFFFQKNVRSLDLAESAMLAALIRSPGLYDPRRALDRAKGRRDFILSRMLEQNLISTEDHDRSRRLEIRITRHTAQKTIAPYFIDFLKEQLTEAYSEEVLVSEGLRIFTTLDTSYQEIAEEALQAGIKDLEKRFPKLASNKSRPLQSSIVVLQPQTGHILAMMGGRSYRQTQFNRVVHSKRQPGSVFKPFVYLAGFIKSRTDEDFQFTAADVIEDGPVTWKLDRKRTWKPNNFKNAEYGPVTIRMGLEKSINRVTVMLAQQIGLMDVKKTALAAGITSKLPNYPSVVLGASEVTPLEIAAAYGTLASQGSYARPFSIKEVEDAEGNVLEKKSMRIRQVVDPQAAYLTTYIMQGVMDHGTGAAARRMGFSQTAAGKTGTTNDSRDNWFVGYTPNLLCAVWVGFDDNSHTGLTGSSGALPIWTRFMKHALAGSVDEPFPVPPGITFERIDRKNGKLAVYGCPVTIDEAFLDGTEPTEECLEHKDPIIERFKKSFSGNPHDENN